MLRIRVAACGVAAVNSRSPSTHTASVNLLNPMTACSRSRPKRDTIRPPLNQFSENILSAPWEGSVHV